MRPIAVPVAGIVAAALLDQRWSWGTVAGILAPCTAIVSTAERLFWRSALGDSRPMTS